MNALFSITYLSPGSPMATPSSWSSRSRKASAAWASHPKDAATADPGFFAKLFSFGKSDPAQTPGRYRIAVKTDGAVTNVSVQNAQGGSQNGAVGQRIVGLLVEDLK